MEYYEIFFILFSLYTYVKTKNLLYVFINAFAILYFLNITLITKVLNLSFSPSQSKFDTYDFVTVSVLLLLVISWLLIGKTEITFINLPRRKSTSRLDLVKGIVIILYSVYLIYDKGFRLQGDFLGHAGERKIYEDYIALIFLMFFISGRASKFLVFSFLFIGFSYFLAGERMRMFIYLGAILIYLYPRKLNILKVGLIFAYIFAEVISLLRSQIDFGVTSNGEYISHFGSVTISSLYLNKYTSTMLLVDKLKYYAGIFMGNVVPTFVLPDGYDIRSDLFSAFDIPGGGWFPVFILCVSNWYVFTLTIVLFFTFIRFVIKRNNLSSEYFIFILIITSPRWLMYSPYLIFRFALYASILLFFIKKIKTAKNG